MAGTGGLGRVFYHRDAMTLCNGNDLFDASGRPHHVNRDNCLCFGGNFFLQILRIHI